MFEALSILLIFLGLSILVVIHELGHFLAAKWSGLLVEEFGFGLPPRLWGKKIGETLYSLNWLLFGGFVRIYGENRSELSEPHPNVTNNTRISDRDTSRSFSHQSVGRRALITVAGVLMNFLLGWFLVSLVFMIGIPQALLVTEVKEGGIAALAGIQKGDQLVNFKIVPELLEFVEKNKSREVFFSIKRGDKSLVVKITPRAVVPEGEGNLGIYLVETGFLKLDFFNGIWQGFKNSLQIIITIFLGLVDLIIGIFTNISVLEKFVGPVGIVNVAIETSKLGIAHFLQLLAIISLNLAVFNIFPIPALDGGRLLFLALEKIKGGPLNRKIEITANALGFAFLLILIFTITIKDILTLL